MTTPSADTGFGIDHLPYGSFSIDGGEQRLGVRLGAEVVDLRGAARVGLMPAVADAPNLDRLLTAGPDVWNEVRTAARHLVGDGEAIAANALVHPVGGVTLHLPVTVADYVDFYSSQQHATNVGRLFRPDAEPLLPNWKHLPVGYHGRAGTVVVSGTPIRRPAGQRREPDGAVTFGPSRKLDIELELGAVLGNPTGLGEPVEIGAAADHIFGIALVNDWSARDIQAWEYVPLGPFLGKSFATTMAAWVTPLAALEPFRRPSPEQQPEPLDYLRTTTPWAFDLDLEVALTTSAMRRDGIPAVTIASTNYSGMYWTMAQQLAHMTVNGAAVRPGDLFASGTISGVEPGSYGSLLELTWNGRDPIELPDGSTRTFLEDGDEVVLRGGAGNGGAALSLGDAAGAVVGHT